MAMVPKSMHQNNLDFVMQATHLPHVLFPAHCVDHASGGKEQEVL